MWTGDQSAKRARLALAIVCFVFGIAAARALPRVMEKLDRGVVAVRVDGGVYVGWRMFGTDPESIVFNVYRDGVLVNDPTPAFVSGRIDRAIDLDGSTNRISLRVRRRRFTRDVHLVRPKHADGSPS